MGNVTLRCEISLRAIAAAILALALSPAANALTLPTLRDLADPVAPGGILPYRIVLNDASAAGPVEPTCFNPPPDCVALPVTCTNPPPSCVGNPLAGFICQNSGNDGADCGVGTPLAPEPLLCIPRPVPAGVCNGGNNFGLPCDVPDGALTTECPGSTFLCKRSYNEGDYCGLTESTTPQCVGDQETGFFCTQSANDGTPCGTEEADPSLCEPLDVEPRPEDTFCLQKPTGICSGGPNFGLVCTVPHGETTPECPTATGPAPTPTNITVQLPLLAGMSCVSVDNGGACSATEVIWTVPPLSSCGVPGTPTCPQLNARLLIDSLVPEGTVYENTATATDQDGFLVSSPHRTLIARTRLRALTLAYPDSEDRDRFTYRVLFALTATETIDPDTEEFRLNVSNGDGTIVEFILAPGLLPQTNVNTWSYSSRAPGLKAVRLRQLAEGAYSLRVRGAQLNLPSFTDLNVTVTVTIGDVTITHPARLIVKRGGNRYVAARSTSTTLLVTPPTTTTSTVAATTTTSTTETSTTSSTTETSTSSSTTETSTSSSTTETSTSSSTTETSTSSSTTETSTSSSTTETSTTSTTTLLPCGGTFPACLGQCPLGQTCTAAAALDPCTCQ